MGSSIASVTTLPAWVNAAQRLQSSVFVSKTVLELGSVNTTMVAMGRSPEEKKAIAFRVGLITLIIGAFAPLHAGLAARLAARWHGGLDHRLLCLTYEELRHCDGMRHGIERLTEDGIVTRNKPLVDKQPHLGGLVSDATRVKTIKAKALLMALDLAAESLMLMNVGPAKNWFTQKITGKRQYAGEIGSTSATELDQLYTYKQTKAPSPGGLSVKQKSLILDGLAIVAPLAMAGMLGHVGQFPKSSPWLHGKMGLFDNDSQGFTLGFVPYFSGALFLNLNEYNTALSDNERLELVLKVTPMLLALMFGDKVAQGLLSKVIPTQGIEIKPSIAETIRQAPQALKVMAGKQAAGRYMGAFALQTAAIAGVIYATNTITRRRVKTQVAEMKQEQQSVGTMHPLSPGQSSPVQGGVRPLPPPVIPAESAMVMASAVPFRSTSQPNELGPVTLSSPPAAPAVLSSIGHSLSSSISGESIGHPVVTALASQPPPSPSFNSLNQAVLVTNPISASLQPLNC
jgi:hypothetical protein